MAILTLDDGDMAMIHGKLTRAGEARTSRNIRLVGADPYALYFKLAHTPNVPLVGVQIAAVKDAARTAWMKRPDQCLPLRVQLPGVRSLDVRDIGAWLAEAFGANVIIDHTGKEHGLILVLTPKADP